MGLPFIGEVKMFSSNYAPRGWALCNGQSLPLQQNLPMFSLIGTTYGGNGSTNFNLPDLRSRTPLHWDQSSYSLGQPGGEVSHTLTTQEFPSHTHQAQGSSDNASSPVPTGKVLASALNLYTTPTATTPLLNPTIAPSGGNKPHENMSPYAVLNFCIALVGAFPSRN